MYDALIIVNGEIPHPILWKDIQYRTLICTDGAALTVTSYGITPDIIIGDMDSISAGPHFSSIEEIQKNYPHSKVLTITEQLSTDFEKALNFALTNKLHHIICLGALGKSADHSIHNLSMLTRYHQSLNIVLMHTFEKSRQWVFVLQNKTCITTKIGETISFFAFSDTTLTTSGLKWELKKAVISHHGQTAMRNITVKDTVEVECQGNGICFLTCDTPPIITYPNNP